MGSKRKKRFKSPQGQANTSSLKALSSPKEPEEKSSKLSRITNRKAILIIALSGLAAYFTGLNNPFQGDDFLQIVNNSVVHSIANIGLFYQGSTFGQEAQGLIGIYYRPLMTTVFSLLYTIFGAHPFYFHFLQLTLGVANAILVYLVFKYSFKPLLSLGLALIFLLHPINSEALFAVPSLQEPLFFFFGILAVWVLLRFSSTRSLFVAAGCLFLSLLAKESGVLFVAVSLLYLFIFDRLRLARFAAIIVLPLAVYFALKVQAVGLLGNAHTAPIDNLGLLGRMLTVPSIGLFYLTKSVFPLHLASGYYWTNSTFSFQHVVLPLLIDTAFVGLLVYEAVLLRKRESKGLFLTYLFFAAWAAGGLLLHLQLIPLDFTVSETWMYFPMVGLLGFIGVALTSFQGKLHPRWALVGLAVIILLGTRTAIRGTDWRDAYTLAAHDIAASKEDYVAYHLLADQAMDNNQYDQAKKYTMDSINIFPFLQSYNDLGLILAHEGDYPGALRAYDAVLQSRVLVETLRNRSEVMLVYGDYRKNRADLQDYLKLFPQDSGLWTSLALLESENNDNKDAQYAITQASRYGQVSQQIYDSIMSSQPSKVDLPDVGTSITIQ